MGIQRELPDADLLVIDDGSRDGTASIARRFGATVVQHSFNLGYGAALQTGYLYARRRGHERIVQMDADGQHDPCSVPDMLTALEGEADLVVGSRYRHSDPPQTSFARRSGTKIFSWIVTKWTGVEITDATSGFQAMSKRALEELVHDNFPEDYPDADVLITLSRAGIRITEIPARMHERKGGTSMHRSGRAAYYAYKMFLTLCLLPVRRRSPFRAGRQVTIARSS
jgi:glycosyltransferase involved in cell wall biosynthesis